MNDLPKQAGHRRGGGAPKRRYEAVKVMAAEGVPVEVACRVQSGLWPAA